MASDLLKQVARSAGPLITSVSIAARTAGMQPVRHSCGKLILRNGAGYIAKTIGVKATTVAAAPYVGVAVTVAQLGYEFYKIYNERLA